jgi:hypothetical protein
MNIITIGNRLIAAEQVAFVELFDPAANPEFKPEKEFKARVVLLNRDAVLIETPPQEFAEAHGLRLLSEDNVALNPAVAFRVETFKPTESFKPARPYLTRVKWRDPEGNQQSKLLVTEPQKVVAELWRRDSAPQAKRPPRRPARFRREARSTAALSTR